jgi:hypothetical protein
MTGFMEKNKYDDNDDIVHTGIKHADIRRHLTSPFSGLKMVADDITATSVNFYQSMFRHGRCC